MARKITDSNAAFFDAARIFQVDRLGLHEVRRQGLLEDTWTLIENICLSSKQKAAN